ncbi:DUF418 domain-containing protein [Virgibacillus byunsanensis]|uniref:DUF418 domain-containing protein n=1 Tax=Virgibacillus byunsanensis TaxID=570945 RepID=A0ABW3LLQ1_9BACI
MNENVSPINKTNRLVWIDAARGFAIFGIFMVNIGAFAAPYFMYGGESSAWSSVTDQYTQAFIDIFFQASFYTLFSLLFGFGFQILVDRFQTRHVNVKSFLLRRLLLLIGFGLIHAFLIWHGDILLSYGTIGLLLLLFIQVRDRTLLSWGFSLLVGSVGLFSLMLFGARNYLDHVNKDAINHALANYQSSNLITIWSQNYDDWMYSNGGGISFLLLVCTLLPLFLFGMYMARKRWLHEPSKHKSLLQRLWTITLFFFLLFKLGPYLFGNPAWFSYFQDNIGGTFSALFYIVSITLLAQTRIGLKLVKPFAYVGRMALTNYIIQSIISFMLFYGIGFGFYGSVSPLTGVVFVIIIFSVQIIWSKWWFSHYLFGPLEWIWRSLTYNRKQPFRKNEKRGEES